MMNDWDFDEVARRRRAMEDDSLAQEDGGGWQTCEDVVLYCGLSLTAYTGIKYKNNTCAGNSNFLIPHPKLN
jgi:hypothetical protein